ncbi:hypothetical protein J27TS7_24890 [Paenibacillus dendritiformis]|nr:hypothetical protein J27TS7_24890 [Paenibacillus dendritiformis]
MMALRFFFALRISPYKFENLDSRQRNYGIGGLHLHNLENESITIHLLSYRGLKHIKHYSNIPGN